MKHLGIKTVNTVDVLPDDWRQRAAQGHVLQRARSLEHVGMIHEPLVRERDNLLVTGADRVTAWKLLGKPKVEVKMIECDDEEAEVLTQAENWERRHSAGAQRKGISTLVAFYAKRVSALPPVGDVFKAGPGRPKSQLGRVIEHVASISGKKPSAVRQALYRERKAQGKTGRLSEDSVESMAVDLGAVVESYGLEMDPEYLALIADLQERMRSIHGQLKSATAQFGRLMKQDQLPKHSAALDRMRTNLAEVSKTVAQAVPTHLCPYCKAMPLIVRACAACGGSGTVGSSVMKASVPKELLDTDNPVVAMEGRLVSVSSLMGTPVEAVDDWAAEAEEDDPWTEAC